MTASATAQTIFLLYKVNELVKLSLIFFITLHDRARCREYRRDTRKDYSRRE